MVGGTEAPLSTPGRSSGKDGKAVSYGPPLTDVRISVALSRSESFGRFFCREPGLGDSARLRNLRTITTRILTPARAASITSIVETASKLDGPDSLSFESRRLKSIR